MMINSIMLDHRQRGASLIVGLIFLVAVTLLGVVAMKNTVLQERMAGGSRDHSLAFQAAEAALRDAKLDLLNLRVGGILCTAGNGCNPNNPIQLESGFTTNCSVGRCYDDPGDGLGYGGVPGQTAVAAFPLDGAPSVAYGTYTGAAAIGGVIAQPRYLIEAFVDANGLNQPKGYYRITARAVGANPNTVIVLQEVFTP
jgi:type IV pilus assembly protein PilX